MSALLHLIRLRVLDLFRDWGAQNPKSGPMHDRVWRAPVCILARHSRSMHSVGGMWLRPALLEGGAHEPVQGCQAQTCFVHPAASNFAVWFASELM